MLKREDFMPIPYLKKAKFTGSYQGMRYRLRKKEEGEEKFLEAVIYPEPFCFEVTAEEEKEARDFPFTKEGYDGVVAWLNEQYEAQKERWEKARKGAWV